MTNAELAKLINARQLKEVSDLQELRTKALKEKQQKEEERMDKKGASK